uniref:Uncharacterized protein n=1 Tax=Clastoptera arizonana TaxID=38151 RepID=A0A1B6BXF2_9HEMI
MKIIKHFTTAEDSAEKKVRPGKCTCRVEKKKYRSIVSKLANLFSAFKGTVGIGKRIFNAATYFVTKKNLQEEEVQSVDTSCPSCEEYQPTAGVMCLTCQKHHPHIASSSWYNHQGLRSSIKICFRYHFKQPKVTFCPCSKCNEKNLMFIQNLIENFPVHRKNPSLKATNRSKLMKKPRKNKSLNHHHISIKP